MKHVFKENCYYADYQMKTKTAIVLHDVYCDVTTRPLSILQKPYVL